MRMLETRWCTKVTKQQRSIVAICHFCQRGALLCLWPGVVSNKRSLAAGKDSQRLVHRAKIQKDLWRAATFCTFCALCVQVFFIQQLLLGLSVGKKSQSPKIQSRSRTFQKTPEPNKKHHEEDIRPRRPSAAAALRREWVN